jgi:hypothetical protein
MSDAWIIYTETDEAPALATYSFLPMVQAFTSAAGVSVETRESRSDRFQYVPEIPAWIPDGYFRPKIRHSLHGLPRLNVTQIISTTIDRCMD